MDTTVVEFRPPPARPPRISAATASAAVERFDEAAIGEVLREAVACCQETVDHLPAFAQLVRNVRHLSTRFNVEVAELPRLERLVAAVEAAHG